ncbi:MAG: hypothetical protein WAM68_08705, partial [Acidobacteriaceae bacterium]
HRLDDKLLFGAGVMIEMNSGGSGDVDEFWIVNGPGFFLSKGGQHLREAQTEQREDEESSSQPPEIAVRAVSICARATHSAGDPPLTPFP